MAKFFSLVYLFSLAALHLSIFPRVGGEDAGSDVGMQANPLNGNDASKQSEDEVTFPFYLNCKQWQLPDTADYQILLNYHVDMINNWKDIVRDQMNTLEKCGLGVASSRLIITYSNGEKSTLKSFLKEFSFFRPQAALATYASVDQFSSQGSTTSMTLDVCRAQNKKAVIFHFNTMGSAEYHWDWWRHRSQFDEGPYSRALYWRKYNEYFTIENPSVCIDKVLGGALTCGVNLKIENGHWRYTDDFWVSSCDYEQTLPVADSVPINSIDVTPAGFCVANTVGDKNGGAVTYPSKNLHAELHRTKKERSKQLPYPEEYDETAWRFHLKCPQADLPKGKYKVVLAYHVGMINNWKDIVMDQLETITKCGLGQRLDTLILSYANGEPDELIELIKSYGIKVKPQLIPVTAKPWECPANNATLAHCKARSQNNDEEKTIVFYLHNKGASRYREDWRQSIDKDKQYGKTGVYWRKFLEFFHIERPSLCIEKILDGGLTCGSAIRGRHYSGNFWVGSCEYIASLEPCGFKQTGYIESELWFGRGMGGGNLDPKKYVELYKPPRVDGGSSDQLMYLYRHLMLPEEYADETYGKYGSQPSPWESSVKERSDGVKFKLNPGTNTVTLSHNKAEAVHGNLNVKNFKKKLGDMKSAQGGTIKVEVS